MHLNKLLRFHKLIWNVTKYGSGSIEVEGRLVAEPVMSAAVAELSSLEFDATAMPGVLSS